MRSEVASRVALSVLFALTIYLLYRIMLPFLPGLACSIVLVIAFSPLYARVVTLLRGRRFAGAVIMSLMCLGKNRRCLKSNKSKTQPTEYPGNTVTAGKIKKAIVEPLKS